MPLETLDLDGDRLSIRPIAPTDREAERAFVHALSADSAYSRFMMPMHDLSDRWLDRFTQVDGRQSMALVATTAADAAVGPERFVGVSRYFGDTTCQSCEFAVTIADDWQRRGLGRLLMSRLIEHARQVGFVQMFGFVLRDNAGMLKLARALGFTARVDRDDPTVERVVLDLGAQPIAAAAPARAG